MANPTSPGLCLHVGSSRRTAGAGASLSIHPASGRPRLLYKNAFTSGCCYLNLPKKETFLTCDVDTYVNRSSTAHRINGRKLQAQTSYLPFSSRELHDIEGLADCSGQKGSRTRRRGSSRHRFRCSSDGLGKRRA